MPLLPRVVLLLFLLQLATMGVAHPAYLDCNGLSEALKTNRSIMAGPPKQVPWSSVPGFVLRVGSDSQWTNYSISLSDGLQFVLQTLGGLELTNFNPGMCGSDPSRPGHGLCQKCSTQLFAEDFDCTGSMKCVFGISAKGGASASLLVGWSSGSLVLYASMPHALDSSTREYSDVHASPNAEPALAAEAPAMAPNDSCNFGPTHHSHLSVPLSPTRTACKLAEAYFFLSHGATFFCPHTYDVKLLATVVEDSARNTLCDSHFDSLEMEGASPLHVLRPTLPAQGLPALARGELSSWTSPVLYHVHNFGKNNTAGPDDGWNVTIVRSKDTTIKVVRVLYSREFEVQPPPAALTYLAHANPYGDEANAVLSHFISTSGPSGFDQIATASLRTQDGRPVKLRASWALYLTIDGRLDRFEERLNADESAAATLHMYDETTGLPAQLPCNVTVKLAYYVGISDGFAGFGSMCFDSPGSSGPRSPTTCIGAR